MPAALEANDRPDAARDLIKRGADLLSQQLWCWGRDILREDGNLLVACGFERHEPPADRESSSSVYTLELPGGRRVVLRGFGVFYGDDRLGGVFLRRYEFLPQYTPVSTLERPPWSGSDLPELTDPDESQRDAWLALTADLIGWIQDYEATVAERLGTAYRQSTVDCWEHAKGEVWPASEMVAAWRSLGAAIAENSQAMIRRP